MHMQPIVLIMETAIVKQPIRRVTEVLLMQTMAVVSYATMESSTTPTPGDRFPASLPSGAPGPLHTALPS